VAGRNRFSFLPAKIQNQNPHREKVFGATSRLSSTACGSKPGCQLYPPAVAGGAAILRYLNRRRIIKKYCSKPEMKYPNLQS
jgi:hypothetical protein